MNKLNLCNYKSANIFEFDDPICLYYDTANGMKSIRKYGMPPRASSLYGISTYNLDQIRESHQYINKHDCKTESNFTPHSLCETNETLPVRYTAHKISNYNHNYVQPEEQRKAQQPRKQPYVSSTTKSRYKMSVLTKDQNGMACLEHEIGDNLSSVLREKMPDNDILYNEGKWLCADYETEYCSEAYKVRDTPAYKLFDNKIDDDERFMERTNPKRKFRTRSESEPNEMCALSTGGTWSKQKVNVQSVIDGRGKYQSDLSNKLTHIDEPRAVKLPATPKRYSPARVLLYNNAQSPRPSRHIVQHTKLCQNSPVIQRRGSSLNRLSDYERSKAPSPSLSRASKTNIDTTAECGAYNRKAKSVTPTPTHTTSSTTKLRNNPVTKVCKSPIKETFHSKTTLSSISVERLDRPSSCSSMDDDADQDSDILDDSLESCNSSGSSESDEDGYRSHAYKTTYSGDKLASPASSTTKPVTEFFHQPSEESLVNPESLLVPSIFPNVPPYLSFSSNTKKGPEIPPELFRILKWKVTNIMPRLVRQVLANTGVRLLKKTNDWMGTWGKHMKSTSFKTIRPYQKVNHLPGSFRIGRKDACWKNLQRQTLKYGKKEFGFMPKTYIMPSDLNILRKAWPKYAQRNVKWIIKPPASARGTGIRVVNRWAQIPKRKPLIVQRYIERPLLINGSKFDLRLYVLVTSINPLRVYMYHNGLARFASVKYSARSDTLNERCMHLTNYSINKFSSNYSKNENVNACHGHKWTIKSLWEYLEKQGIRTDRLWDALKNLVMRTLLSGEHAINTMVKVNVESKYSCFELFGFDVLLDADLVPWLLEVNISPSLHSDLPLDTHVKAPLVQSVFNTALYNIPPKLSPDKQKEIALKLGIQSGPLCFDKRMYVNYLSRTERFKHNQFTRKSLEDRDEYIHAILENLTPDDIRCLVVAEDELARCAPLERIFPTNNTHKYLKYTEVPRYYNRLLDAWENRYSKNRAEGIKLLKGYCAQKYHLEVPPSPVRKHLKRRTRTLTSMTRSSLALTTAVKSIKRRNKRHILNSYQKQSLRSIEEEYVDTSSDLETET